jgi:hypothetical protein
MGMGSPRINYSLLLKIVAGGSCLWRVAVPVDLYHTVPESYVSVSMPILHIRFSSTEIQYHHWYQHR